MPRKKDKIPKNLNAALTDYENLSYPLKKYANISEIDDDIKSKKIFVIPLRNYVKIHEVKWLLAVLLTLGGGSFFIISGALDLLKSNYDAKTTIGVIIIAFGMGGAEIIGGFYFFNIFLKKIREYPPLVRAGYVAVGPEGIAFKEMDSDALFFKWNDVDNFVQVKGLKRTDFFGAYLMRILISLVNRGSYLINWYRYSHKEIRNYAQFNYLLNRYFEQENPAKLKEEVLEMDGLIQFSETSSFPEELKHAYVEFKEQGRKPLKIRKKADISTAINNQEILIFPYAKKGQKTMNYNPTSMILIGIVFIAIGLLITFAAAPYGIESLFVGFIAGLFFMIIGFSLLLWAVHELTMKGDGVIIIGPRGVLYKMSKRKWGYFTWNSIEIIEQGWTIHSPTRTDRSDDSSYARGRHYVQKIYLPVVWCKNMPLYGMGSKDTHALLYDRLNPTYITSFTLFNEVIERYWKSFTGQKEKIFHLPRSYYSVINFIMFSSVLVFFGGMIIFAILRMNSG